MHAQNLRQEHACVPFNEKVDVHKLQGTSCTCFQGPGSARLAHFLI